MVLPADAVTEPGRQRGRPGFLRPGSCRASAVRDPRASAHIGGKTDVSRHRPGVFLTLSTRKRSEGCPRGAPGYPVTGLPAAAKKDRVGKVADPVLFPCRDATRPGGFPPRPSCRHPRHQSAGGSTPYRCHWSAIRGNWPPALRTSASPRAHPHAPCLLQL
jgi:hypothetical protein